MGLEIAGPVATCDTPGTLDKASIKLLDTPLNNSSFLIIGKLSIQITSIFDIRKSIFLFHKDLIVVS